MERATARRQREDGTWKMEAWMEPYRDMIVNTGGNSVEDLVNDRHTTSFENSIRAALIVAVHSQVQLLRQLHAAGHLDAGVHSPS